MRRLVAGVAAGGLLLAGCGAAPEGAAPATTAAGTAAAAAPATAAETTTGAQGSLTVFAAASLKTTFTALGDTFEAENPGVTLTFSFAGSSDLVTQIANGAPADVFAAADTANMDKLAADGLVGDPVNFARNTLIIVTPPDNPADVTSFADLARTGVSVVVCADGVPCGTAAAKIEAATGIGLSPVSEEQSVTDVLNKVETGEADAGLVYLTDARSAGDAVLAVPFPEAAAAVNTYPVAVLPDAQNPEAAAAFVDLVTGAGGQAVLADAGFAPAS